MTVDHLASTLAKPKVGRRPDEVLSSWLSRVARAHLLTFSELGEEIGGALGRMDQQASAKDVARIAARLGIAESDVAEALPSRASGPQLGERIDPDWRICPLCLDADRSTGMGPYVRRAWSSMIAAVCLIHQRPLVVPTSEDLNLILPHDEPWRPRQDRLLAELSGEPYDCLARATRLGLIESESLSLVTREVSDLVDGLGVQVNASRPGGAVICHFEHRWRSRHIKPFATQLPEGLIYSLDTADRLMFVRVALSLRWPAPPGSQEQASLGNWLEEIAAQHFPRHRRRVIDVAHLDPLGLFAVALPQREFHLMSMRARSWSRSFRRRWLAVEPVAALSGLP